MKKNLSRRPSTQPQNIKGKKARHLECMLGPSHWLHEISLPKRLGHHNVFIFQVFVGVLVPACENLKDKNSNKW
jgi:hypothetical protein